MLRTHILLSLKKCHDNNYAADELFSFSTKMPLMPDILEIYADDAIAVAYFSPRTSPYRL